MTVRNASLRAAPFAALLRLNASLLVNCVDGMSDDQASQRTVPGTNSVAFIVAHLIDARHTILEVLGGSAENPLATYLESARGMDDVAYLPPLDALIAAWRRIDLEIAERFSQITDESLDTPAPHRYPGGDGSILGALAFLVQHDSYHIGQLALLRRAHGLPAMRYATR